MTNPEERSRRSIVIRSKGNSALLQQVTRGSEGVFHSLHCQEGGKVGCVGGHHQQGEQPPDAVQQARGESSSVVQYIK